MCMYALSLQAVSQAKQCWFADDARGCGSLQNIRVWWDKLTMARPDFGYYPNAGKCWLVMKPNKWITRSIEHSQQSLGQLQFEDPQGITLLHLMSNSQARLSS